MKKNGTTINFDEWQAAIADVARTKIETVPAGWLRIEHLMAPGALTKNGVSDVHARTILWDLMRAGKAERKKFVTESKDTGIIRPVYHYRLKK